MRVYKETTFQLVDKTENNPCIGYCAEPNAIDCTEFSSDRQHWIKKEE